MSDTPNPKSGTGGILAVFYGIWITGMIVAVPYYNWQFAHQHGFAAWALFGEIIPTIKAIFWPIYVMIDNFK
jgi:hypothetical protein